MKRIRIRNPQGWANNKYVCLSISCGQEYHEGENFIAAVNVAKQSGKLILIDLSDALQRYNYMALGKSESEAWAIAQEIGNEWIKRHEPFLQDTKILRWNVWLSHPEYQNIRDKLETLYREDSLFAETVNSDVSKFLARQKNPSELMFNCSRMFILEEATGEILLGRAYPCSRLYPGQELETLRVLRTLLIPNAPMGLDRTRYYRFTLETKRDPICRNKLHPFQNERRQLYAA